LTVENYLYNAKFTFIMVGNIASFTKIDIMRCLLRIRKPISRAELSKTLDLGEGTIRSILDILKKNKLLASNNKGHYLSSKGLDIVNKIKNHVNMKEIVSNKVFSNKKKIAISVKKPKKTLKSYILRDQAVKNGADGAIILRFDKKLILYDSGYKEDFKEIENKFDLSKNDMVIVTYADSYRLAEHGALAAAIEISADFKNILKKL